MLVSLGERKVEEPVLQKLKPSPLPMKICSSPSKLVNCLMFWESPVTWKLAPESGIHVEPGAPLPWEDEFVRMVMGWLSPGTMDLALGLTHVLEFLVEPVEQGIGYSMVG